MSFRRLAGWAGIGFVIVVVIANVILGSTNPPRDAVLAGAAIAPYYTANEAALRAVNAIAPFVWVLLALFAGGLVAAIWPSDRARREAWALVGLIGITMQNAIFAGVIALQAALLAVATGPSPSAGVLEGLWSLHHAVFGLNGASLAIAMTGFSVGGLRAGVMPAWQGGLGLVAGALMLLQTLAVAGVPGIGLLGFGGFLLWLVWIASLGIRLVATAPAPLPRASDPADAAARGGALAGIVPTP
jgi:hypothetical protein